MSVPVNVTRSLKSKMADMLWCAHAEPATNSVARTIKTAILWFMTFSLNVSTVLGAESFRKKPAGYSEPIALLMVCVVFADNDDRIADLDFGRQQGAVRKFTT